MPDISFCHRVHAFFSKSADWVTTGEERGLHHDQVWRFSNDQLRPECEDYAHHYDNEKYDKSDCGTARLDRPQGLLVDCRCSVNSAISDITRHRA